MKLSEDHIRKLITSLDGIIDYSQKLENNFSNEIIGVHPSFRKSARNLLNYLALRNFDLRDTQKQLSELGLSSLGRSEGHVLSSLISVRNNLCQLINCSEQKDSSQLIGGEYSRQLLEQNVRELIGSSRNGRSVRIMVTLSADEAKDYAVIKEMMIKGMDCARINCAHDTEEVWIKIIDNINRAKKETGLSCKILMDLAGLKLRTGRIKSGPQVIRVKTQRDFYGKLVRPARIWLSSPDSLMPHGVDLRIPVDPEWTKQLQPGDKIYFSDKRGKKRQFEIILCEKNGCIAELFKRSYIESGTELFLKDKKRNIPAAVVGPLPAIESPLILKKGDILLLHRAEVEGENARYDDHGLIIEPAHISCSNPEVFEHVQSGDPILFNDGKIEGIITSASENLLVVTITQAKKEGSPLRADKGINLPNTDLGASGLQIKDIQDLDFIARHADIVNMSFVNHPQDVLALQEKLRDLNAGHIGIMLKIETKLGVNNLPLLLLAAMKNYPAGVMIARGDLAVECGWEKLAEIQEEILWLCEAAHVPVVWATQVLESLSKKGSPSRAEITDAAMSQRADCVMLNKGPHILQTIEMLSEILGRMENHQHKKTSMLRNLKLNEVFNLHD